MSDVSEHLRPAVNALIAARNEVLHGGFRPTPGGFTNSLKLPLDPTTAVALVSADTRLQFNAESDELTCRDCWSDAIESAAQRWRV